MDVLIDQEKMDAFAMYADQHELFDLFERMLTKMLIEKPQDPLTWMQEQLQKPAVPSIIICGPPSSGVSSISSKIAKLVDAVFISSGELVREAVEKQTSLGNQARMSIERDEMVSDQVMISLVGQRLSQPDVQQKGYVLDGFPSTREQAFSILMKGTMPEHFVILDVPDAAIISYTSLLRIDPFTKKMYHLTHNPPPATDYELCGRLISRNVDSSENMSKKLANYRRRIADVHASFKGTVRKISSKVRLGTSSAGESVAEEEERVYKEVVKFLGSLGGGQRTKAPRQFKLVVQGLPGSGKTSVARMLQETYGFIHVSPEKIVQEEVSGKSVWAKKLEQFIHSPHAVPSDIMIDLVVRRLKSSDCMEKGWVLEGFPNSTIEAQALQSHQIAPNRVIWLDTPTDTCYTRLAERRYSESSGHAINITVQSQEKQQLEQRPCDKAEVVAERLEKSKGLKAALEEFYGVRTTQRGKNAAPAAGTAVAISKGPGLFQEVLALGVGEAVFLEEEGGGGKSRKVQPTLERVFESVQGVLAKPVPVKLL